MGSVKMLIERMPHMDGLDLPVYKTAGSSGMDLHAAVDGEVEIAAGAVELVPTGLKIAIPEGYEAQVRARSGLAAKHGVFVLNGPGTVDSDYRGEVKVILANFGKTAFTIKRGERIAQMVIMKVETADIEVVAAVPDTVRGEGGFGSSGR